MLVPLHRIELQTADYKTAVIPFNYKGLLAERLRLELRNPLSRVDGLAIHSNTIMGPFLLNWYDRQGLNLQKRID